MAKVAIYYATVQVGDAKYRVNTFPSCQDKKPGSVMAELPFGQSVYGTSYDVRVTKDDTFSIKANGWLYVAGEKTQPVRFEVFGSPKKVGVNLLDEGDEVFPVFPATEIVAGRINIEE